MMAGLAEAPRALYEAAAPRDDDLGELGEILGVWTRRTIISGGRGLGRVPRQAALRPGPARGDPADALRQLGARRPEEVALPFPSKPDRL